jgi:hypothetical protein
MPQTLGKHNYPNKQLNVQKSYHCRLSRLLVVPVLYSLLCDKQKYKAHNIDAEMETDSFPLSPCQVRPSKTELIRMLLSLTILP